MNTLDIDRLRPTQITHGERQIRQKVEAYRALHARDLKMAIAEKPIAIVLGPVPLKYPRLADNPAVLSQKPDSLVRLVLQGGRAPSTVHGPEPKKMPAFADQLTDTEIARVLTFVRATWGNNAPPVTTRDVRTMREAVGGGSTH
ncbi:ParB-like protein [Caballeronia sp. LZ035]|uniref:ParB-like protein n=1 Tax=Caballeronia sp. LZ035 TaxID=3038568 RepID=UPI00286C84F2|nr:ParB-like protein [Caballeronia sp. LZ035]